MERGVSILYQYEIQTGRGGERGYTKRVVVRFCVSLRSPRRPDTDPPTGPRTKRNEHRPRKYIPPPSLVLFLLLFPPHRWVLPLSASSSFSSIASRGARSEPTLSLLRFRVNSRRWKRGDEREGETIASFLRSHLVLNFFVYLTRS